MFILAIALLMAGFARSSSGPRGALIVTLSGSHKLSEYFEWSCRSIGASAALFDMLVFHEGNSMLKKVQCSANVKFIDLGPNGLSKLIVDEVTRHSNTSEVSRIELINLLSDIVTHIPRYLVEPKPMFGTLFADYLLQYSHWSYTDPDIIWGNLADWLDPADLAAFDVITLSKTYDAGRLFIRGQFALHKNIPSLNSLWRGLDYLHLQSFAQRIGGAARMVREGKPSEAVFGAFFTSAEGLYSQLVFQAGGGGGGSGAAAKGGNLSVKIIGRGVDDYSRDPVVLYNGRLYRCSMDELAAGCTEGIVSSPSNLTYALLPAFSPIGAKAVYDRSACRMQWLPQSVRYCITQEIYGAAGASGDGGGSADSRDASRRQRLRLVHVGEAAYLPAQHGKGKADSWRWQGGKDVPGNAGGWVINDESVARRQLQTVSAFFHFRHWDDYASVGLSTTWEEESIAQAQAPKQLRSEKEKAGLLPPLGCMVLYLRSDGIMAFEPCSKATQTTRNSHARGERSLSLRELERRREALKGRRRQTEGLGGGGKKRGRSHRRGHAAKEAVSGGGGGGGENVERGGVKTDRPRRRKRAPKEVPSLTDAEVAAVGRHHAKTVGDAIHRRIDPKRKGVN